MIKMHLDELLPIIEESVPQPAELDFDRIGLIRPTSQDIQKVGVCVDLTDYVMQEATATQIDFLIVHHGHGRKVKEAVGSLGIGAYGLHLALDTAEDGLIEQFAETFKFHRIFGHPNAESIELEYKGKNVPKGAVLIDTEKQNGVGSEKYFLSYYLKALTEEALLHKFRSDITLSNPDCYSMIDKVVVSTGPSIRTEFLEQLNGHRPRLFVSGSCKDEKAKQYARDHRMMLITVGDFESHVRGIQHYSEKLYNLLNGKVSVNFIPNYQLKTSQAL